MRGPALCEAMQDGGWGRDDPTEGLEIIEVRGGPLHLLWNILMWYGRFSLNSDAQFDSIGSSVVVVDMWY